MKKLKEWARRTFGRVTSRNGRRRALRGAGLTWKGVKELSGEAKPEERAAHIRPLLRLFTGVGAGEVVLIYVDEVHVHRDWDRGYTRGRSGQRIWRRSDCPELSDRMDAYGASDFRHGGCSLWQDGWCNGEEAVNSLRAPVAWRAGKEGRSVPIGDNAPCHVAERVKAEAARPGVAVVNLPGYSPDLNPIERPWDRMREGVTRGSCHASVPELIEAGQAFIGRIDRDPVALVDRPWPKFELDPDFEEKLRVST